MPSTAESQLRAHAKRLHASLLTGDRATLNKAGIYARGIQLPFTAGELFSWMLFRSTPPGSGLLWICPYTRERITLQHDKKRPGDAITLDHIVPRAKAGKTELANLAITNVRTNRIKGPMAGRDFQLFYRWMEENLSPADFVSVKKRLGQPPNYRIARRNGA